MERTMPRPELVELEFYSDERGYLVPMSNSLSPEMNSAVKRTYIVGNFGKGVIRGMHFHKKETKIFYIAHGAAKFVGINPDSPEDDRHVFVLSDKKPGMVIIPPGYANGWMSLADDTILVALSTSSFEESAKDDKRYDPYQWGDIWSLKAR
ncbi:MAG: dTDP-4-dehydrorhamnose 3,5-epimerase family protein [Candidatus Omnitrophota bacterium]|nr:dTDP-4-dehydrorhamnose 3,5-epimerase family protein [Candidatus Omnitrophota bacterium]